MQEGRGEDEEGAVQIQLTQEEGEALARLEALGFNRQVIPNMFDCIVDDLISLLWRLIWHVTRTRKWLQTICLRTAWMKEVTRFDNFAHTTHNFGVGDGP